MPAEQLVAGGSGKAGGRKPDIYADEKSDACIVPMNDSNNGVASKPAPAEGLEGRRAAKRNAEQPPAPRTQSRTRASMGLDGVREAACALKASGKEVRFTALMHHITPQLLIESFMQLKPCGIPLPCRVVSIARRGDLHHFADRLDPEGLPMLVDKLSQLLSRRSIRQGRKTR